jgi:glutamine amidotransferase
VNADGFGVAWYPAEGATPCVVTSQMPIWADRNVRELGRTIAAPRILAAVRSATPDMPLGQDANQPFSRGPYLFMHNGYIQNFRHGLMRRLREPLADEFYCAIQTSSDSEHLFAVLLDALARGGGATSLEAAVRETVARVRALAEPSGLVCLLNFVVSDGRSTVACRFASVPPAPSLYVVEDHPAFPGAVLIASEPIVPGEAWRPVPEGGLVCVDAGLHVKQETL